MGIELYPREGSTETEFYTWAEVARRPRLWGYALLGLCLVVVYLPVVLLLAAGALVARAFGRVS